MRNTDNVPAAFTATGTAPLLPTQPSAPDSQPQPRLVPATVGTQTVWIECPRWCAVDHAEPVNHLEDATTHYSGGDIVQVLTLTDDDTSHSELMSTISSNPSSPDPRLRAAHLAVVVGGTPVDAYLTPDMGEQLAADLDVFAAQLRAQARTVRAHNEAQA